MKILLLILFWTVQASAIEFKVLGAGGQLLLEGDRDVPTPVSVGDATVFILQTEGVPFEGSAAGISSIFALFPKTDVNSNGDLDAFGWCYSIDGVIPSAMPDQEIITNKNSSVVWFYSDSKYVGGKWTSQCGEASN